MGQVERGPGEGLENHSSANTSALGTVIEWQIDKGDSNIV